MSATGANRSIGVRLFLTVWLVYAIFATTNVVRETYLAIALGTNGTVRVDPYLGLHPDLFEAHSLHGPCGQKRGAFTQR